VSKLANLDRNVFVFIFGESRRSTVLSPALKALLNQEPALSFRIASLANDLAAGLQRNQQLNSAALNPRVPALSRLPASQRSPFPHNQSLPSSLRNPFPVSHFVDPHEVPSDSLLPISSSLSYMPSSNNAKPFSQHEATHPYPPSIPYPSPILAIPFESQCPSHPKDLPYPPVYHSIPGMFPPLMQEGNHELGCCGGNDVLGTQPELPGRVPSVAPTHLISQRLPGHPPFILEDLSKGGARLIQGLTKAECLSTMQGVFNESWNQGHATVGNLRDMVTQAVARESGISWHL
jgi:hypothetical protein